MSNDLDRAVSALHSIPNDLSGDDWLRPSIAAKAVGIPFDDWHAWCSGASNYKGEADCRARWKSFDINGPIQAGTLFKAAGDNGWREGTGKPARPAPERTAKPPEPPPTPRLTPAQVQAVFDRCEPVLSHHYITAKRADGVPLDTLRLVPNDYQLQQSGESWAGALVVPMVRLDGTLSGLQLIAGPELAVRLKSKGKQTKQNLYGSTVEGWFTVGTVKPGEPVYLTEGIGTAWACWMATGNAAVVCFGWGNIGKVTKQLRQRDASARLVICPDTGKESAADKIALEVGASVAKMPDGWPANSDLSDVFCSPDGGFDMVQALLDAAVEPPKPETKVHPLARFVDFDGAIRPPRWVIPGFIGHGVVPIAGAGGVGKTTVIAPLAMTAAGLHGDDLMPAEWRHVVYVTEDVEQVHRIMAGLISDLNISIDLVRERFHVVEAVRLDPIRVAAVGATYREQFTREVGGVKVLPLVVLDTKSAVMELENENDNSETSRMMAALKQGFAGLPVWLICHVAKANFGRVDTLSSRGASSGGDDANQTLFVIQEGENRFLLQGKKRFEPKWPELEILSYSSQTVVPDEFGNPETVILRWGIARPPQQTRQQAAEQATEQQQDKDDAELRQAVRDAVEVAWLAGNPLNRAGIKANLHRKGSDVVACIENLLSERWLHEVDVPAKVRIHNNKRMFLVNLTTEQHEAVLSGGGLPADKLVIPASWQKPSIPSVPEVSDE
jgi:hypothetical protein